ncbi:MULTISPECIES: RHS repeat domain-containing protein [unclassified Pseudomonas]|uniref:RHS repeat-associated core domain-containing protein n=1 Tax=Pseudomonas sp. MYb327 TaxID=2745230 RepID=A0AAU8E9V5_9PSED
MHTHTPSISVVDPRALLVRSVAYHRRAVENRGDALVTQQRYDAAGRLTRQRDPRLFALSPSDPTGLANLTHILSLTGEALCSDSVDAGWQLGLPGAAGQALEAWDQRGWHRRTEHDSLLRPVAVFEQDVGEDERCVERITWGTGSEEDVQHNRCGQPIRQDDPAGSRLLPDYGISGSVLVEVRHFLNDLENPDWPVSEAARNRLLEPGEGAKSISRYAPSAEMVHQTDAKGHTRHFAHDCAGQLRLVALKHAGQASAVTLVSAIEYTASGQIEYELAGNGMCTRSAFDLANGRMIALSTQGPDNVYLQRLSYAYDPAGNITEIADAALPIQHFANQRIEPVRRFAYDTLYQLISATGWETAKPSLGPALPEWQAFGPPDASRWCNYVETYDYDEAGNLLQRLHHGAVDDTLNMRVASHSNRSVKARSGLPGIGELFDARGNLLELQPGNALHWNGRNQLARVTQVARPDVADDDERYVYDGEGARLRKCRTTVAKTMIHTAEVRYLPGIELHANSATGELLQIVSIQAGRCTVRLLHWDSPPPAEQENDQLRYCINDQLGSSAFEVDAQAKTISQEVYYPFGGTAWLAGRHELETSYKTIRYSGKERDATGLYYYGGRYYIPWLQHWLNPDPAGDVDGLNFYRFVNNAAMNNVDRAGYVSMSVVMKDYYFYRGAGVEGRILHRGLDEITKYMPEAGEVLRQDIQAAKTYSEMTAKAMNDGTLNESSPVVIKHFGTLDSYQFKGLKELYERIDSDMDHLQKHPERIILFAGGGFGPCPKSVATTAFVQWRDLRKRIFINRRFVGNLRETAGAEVILHELSHFEGTEDYRYLNRGWFEGSYGELLSYNAERFVLGDIRKEDIENKEAFTYYSGTRKHTIEDALEIFKKDELLRSKYARNNADSVAAFSLAVSRLGKS